MDTAAFEATVRQVIARLPARFRTMLTNVVVVIEERPHARRGTRRLLGLYEGVPVTEWNREYSGKLPDTITLFKGNIEDHAGAPEEVPRVIRETLLHEIGHHFGLDHKRIGKMERRWSGRG